MKTIGSHLATMLAGETKLRRQLAPFVQYMVLLVAIVVGQAVGGVLMALHSAQGPQMGIPQMIQSRAQFGSWGALLVTVIAAVMYVGFFGVCVNTRTHTPRFCGHRWSAGLFIFFRTFLRPCRTS